MRCHTWAKLALGLAALVPLSAASFAQAQAIDELERSLGTPFGEAPPEVPAEDAATEGDYEELTRGPVHEAFAEQVSSDPTPNAIVAEAPPEAIKELPPENRPAAAKAIWIDGYWAFDDTNDRYIWISGVWRVAPTGYRWTPGYWSEADGGFRWIGGFWASADRSEVAYQPAPPESLEEGPTSAAPDEQHIWVPGCWYYRDAGYVWRPGYWTPGQDNWVWIPNYYRYTPRGYVLCGAYWDVPLVTRGSLFAPVFFHRPIYNTPNWFYTPRVSIGLGPLHFHLFVRPNYGHYYFGDYYGQNYARRGWYPWHTFHRQRHGYDPLFAFNVWHYKRRGIDFGDRYDRWHKYYDRHEDRRPRHTWGEQRDWVAKNRDAKRDGWQHSAIAQRFEDQVRERRDGFVSLDRSDRERYQEMRDRVSDFRRERARSESIADARDGRPDGDRPGRDGSPEVGRNARDLPTMRLPDAISGGERFDRGDRERSEADRREGRDGRDIRDGRPNLGDRDGAVDRGESPRNVLRPDANRDDVTTPRERGEGRSPRGGERTLPSTDAQPDSPSATPGEGSRASRRFDRGGESPRGEQGDRTLPTLPRRNSPDPRVDDPTDRTRFLPQPGTVRDSERPFNTERRVETPRGDTSRLQTPRSETPRSGNFDRSERSNLPRVAPTPRVETPQPQTFNRDALQRRGAEDRRGTSNPFGGERRSPAAGTPRIQQPAPRIQQPTPRVETNRPSFDRGSLTPRSSGRSSPSFSPRSGGGRSSAPAIRSGGSGRSGAPAIRSGGGGGRSSAPSIRSGGERRGGSAFGGGRSGGGGRGRSGGRD